MLTWLRRFASAADEADVEPSGSVRWTVEIPGFDAVGVYPDQRDNSVYVADGWGVAYASLALRKLALDTGEETALVRLGNQARCVGSRDDDPSVLLVATDSTLFQLDRATLEKREKWRRGVPSYTDSIVTVDGLAFLACTGAQTVVIFELDAGRRRASRRVDSGIRLEPFGGDVLACCGREGSVWRLSPPEATSTKIIEDAPFAFQAVVGDELWVSLGVPLVVKESKLWGIVEMRQGKPTDLLRCHKLTTEGWRDARLPFRFRRLSVRADQSELWVERFGRSPTATDRRLRPVAVEVVALPSFQLVATLAAGPEKLVAGFDPEARVAFFAQGDHAKERTELTCVAVAE